MTYRPRTSSPLLLRRGVSQTVRLEVWDDSALAEPTSGTLSIWDGSDTAIVSAQAVTVTAGVATLAIGAATLPATLAYADTWRAQWSLTLGGAAEIFDQPAALVRSVFRAPIVPGDLERRHPEFGPGRELDPHQEHSGAHPGAWISEAEAWVECELWRLGRRAELVLDAWQLRDASLYYALAVAFRWASTFSQEGSRLASQAQDYERAAEAAFGRVQFRYDAAESGKPAEAARVSAVSAYYLTGNRGAP